MATDLPGEDLFVGQVVALIPVPSASSEDALGRDAALRAALAGADEPPPRGRVRARTYSLVAYAPHRAIFMLGDREIDVTIRPLEVDTPLEAAVFRVVQVAGRSLRVTRVVAEPGAASA